MPKILTIEANRTCRICGVEKELTYDNYRQRYINRQGIPVYERMCRECGNKITSKYYHETYKYKVSVKLNPKETYRVSTRTEWKESSIY